MPLALGTVVADRYELIRTIKSGGMGAVYEVRDLSAPGPSLALKEMLEGFADDEEALVRRRFEEEARMLARLSHPGIPAISDFFFRDRFGCIVMEFIRGEDLEHELQDYLALTHRPFPADSLVQDVLDILDVLAYLHGQTPPVVHRDLKPANLIRDWETGRVRLVDFGLARFVREGGMTSQTLVGTLGYCPLEQMQGHSEPRSDLYALGATMHHLLSGKAPKFLDLPPLAEVAPFVDPGLCALVDRAAATEPGDRFATAADMAAALRAWMREREAPPTLVLEAPPPPVEEEPVVVVSEEPVSRGLPGLPMAVGAAVLLVAFGAFLLPRGGAPSTAAAPAPSTTPRRVAITVAATPSPSPSPTASRAPAAAPTLPPLQRPSPSPAPPRVRPSPRVERHPEVAVQPNYPRSGASPVRRPPVRPTPEPSAVVTLPSLPSAPAPAPLVLGLDRTPDDVDSWGSSLNVEDPERSLRVWLLEVPDNSDLGRLAEAAADEMRQAGWRIGPPDRRRGIARIPMIRGSVRALLLVNPLRVPGGGRQVIVGLAEVTDGLHAAQWLERLEELFVMGKRPPGPPGPPGPWG